MWPKDLVLFPMIKSDNFLYPIKNDDTSSILKMTMMTNFNIIKIIKLTCVTNFKFFLDIVRPREITSKEENVVFDSVYCKIS